MTSKPHWSKVFPVLTSDRMPSPNYYGMMGAAIAQQQWRLRLKASLVLNDMHAHVP